MTERRQNINQMSGENINIKPRIGRQINNIIQETRNLQLNLEEKITDLFVVEIREKMIMQMKMFEEFYRGYSAAPNLTQKKILIDALQHFVDKSEKQYNEQKGKIYKCYIESFNEINQQSNNLIIQTQRQDIECVVIKGLYSSNSQSYELRAELNINSVTIQ